MKKSIKIIMLMVHGIFASYNQMAADTSTLPDLTQQFEKLNISTQEPKQLTQIKNVIDSLAQQVNPKELKAMLEPLKADVFYMIYTKCSRAELNQLRLFAKQHGALLEKIPTIISVIIVQFIDSMIELLDNEEYATAYQTIKSDLISNADQFLPPNFLSLPTKLAHQPNHNTEEPINNLLRACESDAFTPLLLLLIANSLRGNSELLNNNSIILDHAVITKKFQETTKKVLCESLKPEEIKILTKFFTSKSYQKLRANFGDFVGLITKHIPQKIVSMLTSVKDWANNAPQNTAAPAA